MANPRLQIRSTVTSRRPAPTSEISNLSDVTEHFNEFYAKNVFTNEELQRRIPKTIFNRLATHIQQGTEVDEPTADVVAQALKEWAVNKGCTHYTHWFQPLRSTTAQKHDSFINFFDKSGKKRFEFSGSELIRGEPDASSFPGGGLRSTHEARGYTCWDPASAPWILEETNGNTLMIPTKYVSWTGDALDHKTPLLRSVNALSKEAVKMLRLLGDDTTTGVQSTLGCEQEFFVIDKAYYTARPDLIATGRTVLGAAPAKGQKMEDHYFGPLPPRIMAFIQESEQTLWKLGVPTKTRHNEVAPGQHEMAPIFEESNLACDHNLVMMETLQYVAEKHDLTVLFHEKPFQGVNGNGKHHNWSMATNTGKNLLNPTRDPTNNLSFLVFMTAVIKAVNEHSDLLRASVSGAGNDHRLGAQEAPPAIMSVYLGEELDAIAQMLHEDGKQLLAANDNPEINMKLEAQMTKCVSVLNLGEGLSPLHRDRTDRNRTSPFAFTGNKFEFRAPGGPAPVSHATMIINLIVADALSKMTREIKKKALDDQAAGAEYKKASIKAIHQVIRTTMAQNYQVVFNGNGYSDDWVKEAESRGLPNLKNTVDALGVLTKPENLKLFSTFKVLNEAEVKSRQHISYEQYSEIVTIEADSLLNLVRSQVLPAAFKYQKEMALSLSAVKQVTGVQDRDQLAYLDQFCNMVSECTELVKSLAILLETPASEDPEAHAKFVRDEVKSKADQLRFVSDRMETFVEDNLWTIPKYEEMLCLK